MNIRLNTKSRIWEIDFIRGIALICMVYFHIAFSMNEFYGYNISYTSGINYYISKASGILFILISGASCSLSHRNRIRGLKILGVALLITITTYLYDPNYIIKFGILHFLGISIILFTFIKNLNNLILLVLGTAVIFLSYLIPKINVNHNLLFPLGIITETFISADYYPLIPWFGLFVYGGVLGKSLYTKKKSIFHFQMRDNLITRLGQNTLIIYLIHQPIILLILKIISLIKNPS